MARARRKPVRAPKGRAGDKEGVIPIPDPSPKPSVMPPSRYLLVFGDGGMTKGIESLQNLLGRLEVMHAEEVEDQAMSLADVPPQAMLVFSTLGMVLIQADPTQREGLETLKEADGIVESILTFDDILVTCEPEALVPEEVTPSPRFHDYLRGYRDAVNNLAAELGLGRATLLMSRSEGGSFSYQDEETGTWGLQATGVLGSPYTGRGVRVAALVDGLDTSHPDWIGRPFVAKSFVPGTSGSLQGMSGTHYLGTALGMAHPRGRARYGIASEAIPYVAKILGPTGQGSSLTLLAGLEWAVAQGCRIILVPLSWSGPAAAPFFETLAARVTAKGGLLISGAGNTAHRNLGDLGFVTHPAACPTVLSVGSVDARLQIAAFSPRGKGPPLGSVKLVAPGVQLWSSVPPGTYSCWSGSATAASYVAGIAALWAEALPDATPRELEHALLTHARPLEFLGLDVGAGLVQAPGSGKSGDRIALE